MNNYLAFIVFAALFCGDYEIFAVSGYWLIIPAFVIYLQHTFSLEFIVAQLLIFALALIHIAGTGVDNVFWEAYLLGSFGVLVASVYFARFDEICGAPLNIWLLVFFVVGSIYEVMTGGLRDGFVFGPNMLYRVLLFFLAMLLLQNFPLLLKLSVGICCAFVCFATLSRGAFASVVMVCALLAISQTSARTSMMASGVRLLRWSLPIAGAVVWLVDSEYARVVNYQDIYAEGYESSAGYRILAFVKAWEFLQNEDWATIISGVGPKNLYFAFYPHNVLVELIVFSGLLSGLVAFTAYLHVVIRLLGRGPDRNIFVRKFLPVSAIFLGALVSGDIWEIFFVFGFGVLACSQGVCGYLANANGKRVDRGTHVPRERF